MVQQKGDGKIIRKGVAREVFLGGLFFIVAV